MKLGGGEQATKGWDHYMGEVDPSRYHVKTLIWQLVGGLGWMKWLKNGAGKS